MLEWGIKNKLRLKDLEFPLLQKLRVTSKTYFAKQKLLRGTQILEIENNKCNSVELIDKSYYIRMPEFDITKKSVEIITKSIRFVFSRVSLTRVVNNIYRIDLTNIFCIVENKVIKCMFIIQSYAGVEGIITWYSESDEVIKLIIENSMEIHISKSDLEIKVVQ